MSRTRKRIVLTGCTRGLGLAMWREFSARGHQLVGCGRSEFPDPIADGQRVDQLDVSNDAAVANWAADVLAEGPVDLLINNAAIINQLAPLWQVPADEFAKLMQINVEGPVNLIRHLVPDMVARNAGMVVNFSSGWGRSTSAEVGPYCASKFAIEALSQAMAQELPNGVGVVALSPGVIHTDMLETVWGAEASQFETPAEWAGRAVDKILALSPADSGRPESV